MKTPTMEAVETETTGCVICSQDNADTLGTIWLGDQMLGRVVQCTHCDLRYMSPRPTQQQRMWLYEREYGSDLPGQHEDTRFESVQSDQDKGLVRFGRYLDLLEPKRRGHSSASRPRLLDIGAGTGQLLELARERGWQVFAVEQSGDACSHLAGLFGSHAVVGRDLADCRDSQERFDAIVMAHTIEHLPDPLASLREVRRLLSPGGQLLVATPNELSLYERLWMLRQRRRGHAAANPYVTIQWQDGAWVRTPSRDDEQGLVEFQILTTEHLYFFTRQTLRRLLRTVGLRDVRWSAGSVAKPNSRVGRLLRNDPVNRAAFLLGLQSELVVVAGEEDAVG